MQGKQGKSKRKKACVRWKDTDKGRRCELYGTFGGGPWTDDKKMLFVVQANSPEDDSVQYKIWVDTPSDFSQPHATVEPDEVGKGLRDAVIHFLDEAGHPSKGTKAPTAKTVEKLKEYIADVEQTHGIVPGHNYISYDPTTRKWNTQSLVEAWERAWRGV